MTRRWGRSRKPPQVNLPGGAYSLADMYDAGRVSAAVYALPRRVSVQDCRRAEYCRPLQRDVRGSDDPFFCELGTLWCTEGHGDWEVRSAEHIQRAIRRRHRFPRRLWRAIFRAGLRWRLTGRPVLGKLVPSSASSNER